MKKIICLALVLALLAPSLCAADADANAENLAWTAGEELRVMSHASGLEPRFGAGPG